MKFSLEIWRRIDFHY